MLIKVIDCYKHTSIDFSLVFNSMYNIAMDLKIYSVIVLKVGYHVQHVLLCFKCCIFNTYIFLGWQSCAPIDLFDAPVEVVVKKESVDIKRTLENVSMYLYLCQCRYCHFTISTCSHQH